MPGNTLPAESASDDDEKNILDPSLGNKEAFVVEVVECSYLLEYSCLYSFCIESKLSAMLSRTFTWYHRINLYSIYTIVFQFLYLLFAIYPLFVANIALI